MQSVICVYGTIAAGVQNKKFPIHALKMGIFDIIFINLLSNKTLYQKQRRGNSFKYTAASYYLTILFGVGS